MTEDETPKLNILVATPVYGDSVKRAFWHSQAQAMTFFALAKSDVPKHIDLACAFSSNLCENRHVLVSKAFQFNASHMLFWDSDIKAPPDCIVKLVNHHLPIVAVNYPTKEPEPRPTAFIETDDYIGPCFTQKQHTGLQAVSSCGFGLMLIEMGVLQAMSTPLFQFTQDGPEKIKTETEDVFFCRKARESGFDIVIDHDLSKQIEHYGDWGYTNEHANIAQAAKQKIYRAMPTNAPDAPL